MRGNPEGGELDPNVDDRRRCKKNFPSYIDKRIKECCDLGSEFGTIQVGWRGRARRKVPLKRPKEFGKRINCERDIDSRRSSRCAVVLQ